MASHPKRRCFYSFHFQADAWRAAQVRNIGVTEHNEPVSDNDWERIRRGGAAAIQQWINQQMATRSCVIVLIGEHTYSRKWVLREIQTGWEKSKGILAIHIHKLEDQNGKTSTKGPNPFNYVALPNGLTVAHYAKTYDPPQTTSKGVYAHIASNLAGWVEVAIARAQNGYR